MTGAIRVAVAVSERNVNAAVRLLRAWIEDPDTDQDVLVFHRVGSQHREPDGSAYFVDASGTWRRPAEIPVHA